LTLGAAGQQPAEKKQEKKGQYEANGFFPPDEATLKQIKDKTEELRKAIEGLLDRNYRDVICDVEDFGKAADNIVSFEEWYAKDSVKWALTTLEHGLARAKQVSEWRSKFPGDNDLGDVLWQHLTGKWVVRGYKSEIDDSFQPYAVSLPEDYA